MHFFTRSQQLVILVLSILALARFVAAMIRAHRTDLRVERRGQ